MQVKRLQAMKSAYLVAIFALGLSAAPLHAQTAPAAPAAPAAPVSPASPPASGPSASTPQAEPQPAPAAPAAEAPAAATPPATAEAPARPADPVDGAGFGDEVTLNARPALVLTGRATWDDLYGTFRRSLDQLTALAKAQGAVAAGPPMVRFVSSTDEQADFEAILPVVATTLPAERYLPARPGTTPAGKAYRFVHFGGYDTMEQTYDEITNFLDARSILAEDSFVEEYVRDPETTSEVDLATFIYVFPKR
jgi:effector-binding domain-containing protein